MSTFHTDWTEVIYTIVDEVIIDSDTTIGSDFSWLSKTSMELADFNFEAPNYAEASDLKRLIDKGVSKVENKPLILHQYALEQNYPNPFNPRTIINYELPIRTDVEISIYNMLGQKIVTLVSEEENAGRHQVEWDASGFASGVYFYKLQAGAFTDMKKMILLR